MSDPINKYNSHINQIYNGSLNTFTNLIKASKVFWDEIETFQNDVIDEHNLVDNSAISQYNSDSNKLKKTESSKITGNVTINNKSFSISESENDNGSKNANKYSYIESDEKDHANTNITNNKTLNDLEKDSNSSTSSLNSLKERVKIKRKNKFITNDDSDESFINDYNSNYKIKSSFFNFVFFNNTKRVGRKRRLHGGNNSGLYNSFINYEEKGIFERFKNLKRIVPKENYLYFYDIININNELNNPIIGDKEQIITEYFNNFEINFN